MIHYITEGWIVFCIIFFTDDQDGAIINEYHSGACGGHLSGLVTTQKILQTDYFWLSLFKDCVEVVKKCHPCQVFTRNMCSKLSLMHPFIIIGPFTKWGVDVMDYNPTSVGGHHHIIVAVDYFTKWDEAMPTIKSYGEIATFLTFNHIIA
jgi:hypothetical protein